MGRSNEEAHNHIKELLDGSLHGWVRVLGLSAYEIEIVYLDSFDPEEDQDGDFHTCMCCEVKWHYEMAKIKVYLPSAVRFDDEELEKTLVHELCHILLSPEQACCTKTSDSEKVELTTERVSRALYNLAIGKVSL